jgi:pimeloyl-ACP methyl ester carboxylesterase
MGGVAAMVLASGWHGVEIAGVVAIGVKTGWTDEDHAQAAKLAQAPVRRFATRDAAIERFLRVSGLAGLVDPGSSVAASGIVEDGDDWRLAADNRTALVAGVDTVEVYRLARGHTNVRLAAGENDPMVPSDELHMLAPEAIVLDGLGHNAHVEDPGRVWSLISDNLDLRGGA